jgi:uncharacterized membrane protein YccC
VNTGLLIALVVSAALAWFWWSRRRSDDAERQLRRLCFGNQGQVDRLIDGELRRASGGISRQEAAHRAVERHRRDNR